jgi:hypothetical protein
MNILVLGGGDKIRLNYLLPLCLLLMIFFTVQLTSDPVSATTTYQTNNVNSITNQNSSVTNLKTSSTQKSTKVLTKSQTTTSYTTKISFDSLKKTSKYVKTYILLNHKLPNYVKLSTKRVTMPQFLELMCSGVLEIRDGSTAPITLRTVRYPGNKLETVPNCYLTKTEYLTFTKSLKTYLDRYHKVPTIKNSKGYYLYGTVIYTYCNLFEFQSTYKRLPNTISIKPWVSVIHGRQVYITSDSITNSKVDNARMNSIVQALISKGIYAKNWGLGPNTHIEVLQSTHIPKDALVIDIYGGACAGTLFEMGANWYKSLRGAKKVFTVFWPPSTDITGLKFLPRAHDDNFTPKYGKVAGFPNWLDRDHDGIVDPAKDTNNDGVIEILAEDGLAHPDDYLRANGYKYMNSNNINSIVSAIIKLAFT